MGLNDRGMPRRAKSRRAHAFCAVFEQDREDVVDPHQGDGAAPEIGHVGRKGEGGEVGHRIGHLVTHRGSHEDAALEPIGKRGLDAVGPEGGHSQPARLTAPPTVGDRVVADGPAGPYTSNREEG